jgi:hypothetical protein
MVDDDLAGVAPWGFDPGQVRPPVLFLHGAQDRMVPSSHGEWLAHRTPSAELWLRPDDGHVSVLGAGRGGPGLAVGARPPGADPRKVKLSPLVYTSEDFLRSSPLPAARAANVSRTHLGNLHCTPPLLGNRLRAGQPGCCVLTDLPLHSRG